MNINVCQAEVAGFANGAENSSNKTNVDGSNGSVKYPTCKTPPAVVELERKLKRKR